MKRKKQIYMAYLHAGIFSDTLLKNSGISEEDFLLELVNKSKFKDLKGGEKFHPILVQNNAENDIENTSYACDFKLVVSSDYAQTASQYKSRAYVLDNGLIAVFDSRKKGSKDVVDLVKTLRAKSLKDLIRIDTHQKKLSYEEQYLTDYIRNLKKDKNLFMFLPAEFICKTEVCDLEGNFPYITKQLYQTFLPSKQFRERLEIQNKDMYLTFIYGEEFVIMEIGNTGYTIIDQVPCKDIKLFQEKIGILEDLNIQ